MRRLLKIATAQRVLLSRETGINPCVKGIFCEGVKIRASGTPIIVQKEQPAFFIATFYIDNGFF